MTGMNETPQSRELSEGGKITMRIKIENPTATRQPVAPFLTNSLQIPPVV